MREPVILHWLGEMFDPALAGYWVAPAASRAIPTMRAQRTSCAAVINANAAKVDGVKVSLLDAARRSRCARRLPQGVRMYTGDDFNFAELIGGDATGHSDALLGIFDAIAPAASAALTALARGDRARFDAILAPTVPLSRHVFAAPTRFYKTGVVFMRVAQRPPVALHDGRRPAERAQRPASLPNCSGSPMPPACSAIRSSRSSRMRAFLRVQRHRRP